LRQPTQLSYVATCRSTLAALEGRFQEAERLADEAFRYGEKAEREMAVIYRHVQLYVVRRAQGRLGELEEGIRRAVQEFPTYVVLRCVLADLYAWLGRKDEARAEFETLAAERFSALPRNDEWLYGMTLLAGVAAFLEEVQPAATLYELLLPFRERNAVSAPDACNGSISHSLGILAGMLGRPDEAQQHFEYAVESNARIGARPWEALTQYEYGRMLSKRARPEDHTRALELLRLCRQTASELGMQALLARVAAVDELT
ncbi:MAG: hypothetical protein M3R37_13065, partial [Actinomycetota bacterium]|nr:hypothetical protein [Actinomycetota bacterium]